MGMRQVVVGVWGVSIQEVGGEKWALLAISGLGELEKLKHCHNPTHPTHRPARVSTQSASVRNSRENRPTPAAFRTGAHRACTPRIRGATAASTSR